MRGDEGSFEGVHKIAVERLRQSVLPLNVQDEERQEQGNLI